MWTLSKSCSLPIGWTSNVAGKTRLVVLSFSLAGYAASALAATQVFKWEELQKQGRISGGAVLLPEAGLPGHRLKIENSKPNPSSVTVLTIDAPQIAGPRYMVSGQVRYDNVEGASYLELWNYFPGGGQYFSRTMAEQGPMMKLHGTSGWRSFVLPFDATGAPSPTRLVMNVVLQGRGTVYLGPLELSEQKAAVTSGRLGVGSTDDLVGKLGGIVGVMIGCIGGLIGLLTSLGRARRFVIASATSLIAIGTLAFVAGVIAFVSSRSYSSLYPLLLFLGFLTSVVPLGLLPIIRKRYEEVELRTMRAHDLG